MTKPTIAVATLSPSGFNAGRVVAFFVSALFVLCLSLAGYVGLVSWKIEDSPIPATYKSFLLQEVPVPRLIIEGGSNAHIGIDTDAVSAALSITAINIADNGGYDIEQKIARLKQHTRPGDVVILPLEWSHYMRESLTDDFVRTLSTGNRDYFHHVGLRDKVRLALHLPPQSVLEYRRTAQPKALDELSDVQALYASALMRPSGHAAYKNPRELAPGVAGKTCDGYFVGDDKLQISNKFRRALGALKQLRARGVKVAFAWPVMVGDDCFDEHSPLRTFAAEVEATVQNAGFRFIGRPEASVYPTELRDDTPYHLIKAGTDIHTARFIGLIRVHGLMSAPSTGGIVEMATDRLSEFEAAFGRAREIKALQVDQLVQTDDPQSLEQIDFLAGWWGFEPYGRWMRDREARLRIRLPVLLNKNPYLSLRGEVFANAPLDVEVGYEGEVLKRGPFGAGRALVIPLEKLPRGAISELTLRIVNLDAVKSPFSEGQNQDQRTLTLHLQALTLMAGEPKEPVIEPFLPKRATWAVLPRNERVPLGGELVGDRFAFGTGWWAQEPNGRWMKCCEARLSVTLPDDLPSAATLNLFGDVFGGQSAVVEAEIGGEVVARAQFSRAMPLQIPLADIRGGDLQVLLRFPDADFESPKDLGQGGDTRVMSGFIEAAELSVDAQRGGS